MPNAWGFQLPTRSRSVRRFLRPLNVSVPGASTCWQVDDARACVRSREVAPKSHAAQSRRADGVLSNVQSVTEQ